MLQSHDGITNVIHGHLKHPVIWNRQIYTQFPQLWKIIYSQPRIRQNDRVLLNFIWWNHEPVKKITLRSVFSFVIYSGNISL